MNIPITLDAEYQNALNGMLARYNEYASIALTEPEYLATVLHGVIGAEVKALFDAELARIGSAVSSLSYAGRQALISQIDSQLP